jgi:hypothetical protein
LQELFGNSLADMTSNFIVNADHLLWVAMLSAADVAFFHGARAIVHRDHRIMINAQIEQHAADARSIRIGSNDPRQRHARSQCAEHGGHATGAAQPLLPSIGMQEDYRRFLADSLRVSPDIPVKHQIANDEDAWLTQVLHQMNQIDRHFASP